MPSNRNARPKSWEAQAPLSPQRRMLRKTKSCVETHATSEDFGVPHNVRPNRTGPLGLVTPPSSTVYRLSTRPPPKAPRWRTPLKPCNRVARARPPQPSQLHAGAGDGGRDAAVHLVGIVTARAMAQAMVEAGALHAFEADLREWPMRP